MSEDGRKLWTEEEDAILIKYMLQGGILEQTDNLIERRTKYGCRNRYRLLEDGPPTKKQKKKFKTIYAKYKDDIWKSVIADKHIAEPWKGLPRAKVDLPEDHWYTNHVSKFLQDINMHMWDFVAQKMLLPHELVEIMFWDLDEEERAGKFAEKH